MEWERLWDDATRRVEGQTGLSKQMEIERITNSRNAKREAEEPKRD